MAALSVLSMQKRITVLVVDDHPVFRAGLVQVISQAPEFEIVGQANDGVEALEILLKCRPDMVVADIDMPRMDGLALARKAAERQVGSRFILLTMHKKEDFLREALALGIRGYVLKDNAVLDILEGLKRVASGSAYVSASMSAALVDRDAKARALLEKRPALAALTSMERQILRLVADNRTTKEIAAKLFISPLTVETHRRNIAQKLDLHGSHRLLQFAIEHRHEL